MKLENYKIPDYSLSESIKFIEPIAFSGFSSINKFQYANLRGYNASGGAYNLRLSSARLWGLISDGNPFSMTAPSDKIFNAKSETDNGLNEIRRPNLLTKLKNFKDIFSPNLIISGGRIKDGGWKIYIFLKLRSLTDSSKSPLILG